MSEWILNACFNIFMSVCGQAVTATYPTEESCYRALDRLEQQSGFEQGYCRPRKVDLSAQEEGESSQ